MAGKPRLRCWRSLGVRTMLVVILVVAVCLGRWVDAARRRSAAAVAVQTSPYSANVIYDDDADYWPDETSFGLRCTRALKAWMPASLQATLGKDYFHDIRAVAFSRVSPSDPSADREVFRGLIGLQSLDQLAAEVEARDEDVAVIARLPHFRCLSLRSDSPRLTDASFRSIGAMTRLESLEIHDAPITDSWLAHLRGSTSLRSLLLGEAQPLSTESNRIAISGEGLAHLTSLQRLESLEIHSASLTGTGLDHLGALRHLKQLRVKGGSFADDDLRHLAALTELESLEIVGSGISGTGLRHLTHLPRLSYVCLEGSNMTDAAISHLAQLPSLSSVMIYGTRVTAEGLEALRAAPSLSQMGLVPAVTGDTKRLKQALPKCTVLNGGRVL